MASSQPLNDYKTWVFKVSIHCEGCKRKVKKILQTVPGVRDIEIETRLQRVMVTGDVAPETLLRKLLKSGKHAELWPQIPPQNPGNVYQSPKSEAKPKVQQGISEDSTVHEKEIKPPTSKTEVSAEDSAKKSDKTAAGGGVTDGSGGKVDEAAGKTEAEEKGAGGEKGKVEENKPATGSAGDQASQPVGEKKEDTEKAGPGGGAGGEESKKKKKKKGQNGIKKVMGETSSSASPPVIGGGGPQPTTLPANQSPPRHHGYQYPPPHYYAPPPPTTPVYAVSYNTAHPPVNSYTASYYASPPPYSYAYSYPETENRAPPPPPPSDLDSYPRQPLDSFEMFSDENPNGCWVM